MVVVVAILKYTKKVAEREQINTDHPVQLTRLSFIKVEEVYMFMG
jgi:hypothetical protein